MKGDFAQRIVQWQSHHGRHHLPWQGTTDPYRIWLSEIMLQQTQVSTVLAYYQRFLERFPDVQALAAAPAEDVMALWAGLGYYTRARNLHRCAQVVVAEHGGRFPGTAAELATLPGIGRSTGAAIAAFAYGERAAILDGNVRRVLARHQGIEGDTTSNSVQKQLWIVAEQLLPAADTPDLAQAMTAYTQGMMDLGATVCTRGMPECAICPVKADCIALKEARQLELPGKRVRKAQPLRERHLLWVQHGNLTLLERRPPTGIWGGLLSLPELDLPHYDDDTVAQACRALGLEPLDLPRASTPFEHVFTHFRLHATPWRLQARSSALKDDDSLVWLPPAALGEAGMPAPIRRLLLGEQGSLF